MHAGSSRRCPVTGTSSWLIFVALMASATACSETATAPAWSAVACAIKGDCADGQRCVSGFCAAATCTTAAECDGEDCVNGLCVAGSACAC